MRPGEFWRLGEVYVRIGKIVSTGEAYGILFVPGSTARQGIDVSLDLYALKGMQELPSYRIYKLIDHVDLFDPDEQPWIRSVRLKAYRDAFKKDLPRPLLFAIGAELEN